MEGEKILDISWGTIFKIGMGIFILYALYSLRDILMLVIFALIISSLFNPAIDFFTKKKIPRILAVGLIYFIVFGILGILIYFSAKDIAVPKQIGGESEFQQIAQTLPQYFNKASPVLKNLFGQNFANFDTFTKAIQGWLNSASSSIFNAIGAIFGGIFSSITIFSLAVFFSLEEKGIEKTISLLFPKRYEAYVLSIWERVQIRVSAWFGTRVLSSIFVGILTFIACEILAIGHAAPFSLLAAITNIVPIVGPLIAGAIIAIFAILGSWQKAIFFIIIFTLIHQIEGNILTPLLTRKFIGMPPVLVIIALLVGGKLWGGLGAILAIPLFGILVEFTKDYLKKKREEKVVVL
ncbi:MAG: AI-2E family transporter [Candidatus Pacebacteria bacterium]|nr:AI-2E family transporter [Candidatus Paceibacterota bacterium]